MITARINGITVKVPVGTTILEAAKRVQIKIPTLCAHPDLRSRSSCGICIVKAKGINKMLRACCTPIEKDMDIITHDAEIVEIRRTVIELILSKHPNECLTCTRNHTCELQQLAADFGILRESFPQIEPKVPYDDSTGAIAVDRRKCILCGRCVDVCQMMQNVWALSFLDRGIDARVAPAGEITLEESPCIRCGQCSAHCPTGAIVEHDDTPKVWAALQNPDLHCVVQIAPAVRVAVGDILGYPPGTNLTRKLYAAFRRLGFDSVFDTNFGADVTIVEEGTEFVHRFTKPPINCRHHELQPCLGRFHGEIPPRCRAAFLILQIASPDRRRSGQDLLRKEEKT
jgi:NADH-quinone oxidoreductase subunit G